MRRAPLLCLLIAGCFCPNDAPRDWPSHEVFTCAETDLQDCTMTVDDEILVIEYDTPDGVHVRAEYEIKSKKRL